MLSNIHTITSEYSLDIQYSHFSSSSQGNVNHAIRQDCGLQFFFYTFLQHQKKIEFCKCSSSLRKILFPFSNILYVLYT